MDLGIAGRKALVCAASKGLGKACAMSLAREGAAVTIVARTPGPLAEAAGEIGAASGSPVATVAADIATEEGRAAALAGSLATPPPLGAPGDTPAPPGGRFSRPLGASEGLADGHPSPAPSLLPRKREKRS